MDITNFFDRKKRELSSQSADGNDSKRPHERSNNSTSTPTSPGDVFEESWMSGDCVKMLVNCIQNIEKHVKELILLAQKNKGESDLSELTKAIANLLIKKEKGKRKTKLLKSSKVQCLILTSLLKSSKINSIARSSTRVEIVY